MSYTLRAWRRQLLSQDRGIVRVHAPDFGVVELAGLVHVYGSGLVNIPGYGPVLVPDHGSRPRTKTPLLPGTTRPGRPTTTHNDNDAYPTIQHNNIDRAPEDDAATTGNTSIRLALAAAEAAVLTSQPCSMGTPLIGTVVEGGVVGGALVAE